MHLHGCVSLRWGVTPFKILLGREGKTVDCFQCFVAEHVDEKEGDDKHLSVWDLKSGINCNRDEVEETKKPCA